MADVNITLVQLGKGSEEISVPEGSTVGQVLERIPNAENLDVRTRGLSAREQADQRVEANQRFTAQPPQLKNG